MKLREKGKMHFTSYQPLNINVTLKKITFSDKAGTFNHWGNNILFIKWYWNTWPVICMTNYIIIQNQNKFQIDFRFCFFFQHSIIKQIPGIISPCIICYTSLQTVSLQIHNSHYISTKINNDSLGLCIPIIIRFPPID